MATDEAIPGLRSSLTVSVTKTMRTQPHITTFTDRPAKILSHHLFDRPHQSTNYGLAQPYAPYSLVCVNCVDYVSQMIPMRRGGPQLLWLCSGGAIQTIRRRWNDCTATQA